MTSRPAMTADEVVALLGLEPMGAEQIAFRRFYASPDLLSDGRPMATAIVCLLSPWPASYSDFHRLPTDELWHFYAGDPIELVLLKPDGSDETLVLGTDLRSGQLPFAVVPAGLWMGARLCAGGGWALFGATMSPGFAPADFDGGAPDQLVAGWPARRDDILAMTRADAPRGYGA